MVDILKNALTTNILPRTNSKLSRKKKYVCYKCKKNKIDCICNKLNILIRPVDYEETCFIFEMVENTFGVNSSKILSLKKLVTEIIYPFSDNYDFYRLNYNRAFIFFPVAIVRAHNIDDIKNTIIFCRETGIPIRARGGAHCYQPASLVNFGIILDQIHRNKIVNIDKKNNVVQIQAGSLLGPTVNELSKHNFLIPTGTCVTNGLAGLTLGGGIGFSLREYGLTMDQIINMKVILANGNIIDANKKMNSDLFWALRGAGGGNFGIVTDFTFNFIVTNWLTIFTIYYNFNDTKKIFKIWQEWAPYTNTKLTTEFDIFNKFQPIIVTGQLLPGKNKESDQKKLFKLIKPLLNLNIHTSLSIKTVSLEEGYKYFGEGSYGRPLFFYNLSDFNFEPLPDKAIDIIIHHMEMLDERQSYHKTEINALGGNFSKIPSDATAFPSRSAIHWIQYTSLWDVSCEEKENVLWLNNYYHALRPFFPKNRKYVNALDYNVKPLRALKSYYGDNLLELIKIKNKYDPSNFFKFEQSIPSLDDFG